MRPAVLLIVALIFPAVCLADTIHVPGDYLTIQEGINAAVNGDVVLVAPGTYFENIGFQGKTITVQSEKGPVRTVVDGQKSVVASFGNYENNDSVLDGFTINNGKIGIYCKKSCPTLINNIVTGNVAGLDNGGGIFCYESYNLKLINCIVVNNSSVKGGGVYCGHSTPKIINCTIAWNWGSKGHNNERVRQDKARPAD